METHKLRITSYMFIAEHISKRNDIELEYIYPRICTLLENLAPIIYRNKNSLTEISHNDYCSILSNIVKMGFNVDGRFVFNHICGSLVELRHKVHITNEDYVNIKIITPSFTKLVVIKENRYER